MPSLGGTDPFRPGLSLVHGGPMVAVDTHLDNGCGLPCFFDGPGGGWKSGLGHILTWDDYIGVYHMGL